MSNEEPVRLVLDKLVQEKGFDNWNHYSTIVFSQKLSLKETIHLTKSVNEFVKRAAELAFVAGQKQKEKEAETFVKEINKKKRMWDEMPLKEYDKSCDFCRMWKKIQVPKEEEIMKFIAEDFKQAEKKDLKNRLQGGKEE